MSVLIKSKIIYSFIHSIDRLSSIQFPFLLLLLSVLFQPCILCRTPLPKKKKIEKNS